MKKTLRKALLFLTLSGVSCFAQGTFPTELNSGDRVLIGNTLIRFFSAYDRDPPISDSVVAKWLPADIYEFFNPLFENYHDWGPRGNCYSFGITFDHVFAGIGGSTDELFPLTPPGNDTLWLYRYDQNGNRTKRAFCTNTRVFDTTVFAIQVHAFTTEVRDLNGSFTRRYTVSDKLWLLRIEDKDTSYSLNGFKIGLQSHGMGPYVLEFPNLCTNLEYHYHEYLKKWFGGFLYDRHYQWKVRDTTINNTKYFFLNPQQYGFYPVRIPDKDPVRRSGNQLIVWENDSDRIIEPFTAYLGDYYPDSNSLFITQIDTVDMNGKRLRILMYQDYTGMDGYRITEHWYGGVGLHNVTLWNDHQQTEGYTTLSGYTPCPFDPSAVPNLPSLPFWQSVVYPSPARDGITIAIQQAATAAPLSGMLLITDALGRTALTLPWDDITERSALAIPIAGFAPGVYYYRLLGSEAWLAGQFVVGR